MLIYLVATKKLPSSILVLSTLVACHGEAATGAMSAVTFQSMSLAAPLPAAPRYDIWSCHHLV